MQMLHYIRRKLHNLTHPVIGEVLMLHRVVENRSKGDNRELEVTPQYLEQTILDYRSRGYRFASLDEICDALGNRRRGQRLVCLTFDDGYRDTLTAALPIMKRHNVPFAIYITTGFIDNKQPMWWYPEEKLALSIDELLQLANEPLCTIGAHTVSHPRLDSLDTDMQCVEIAQSKHALEQLLGCSIGHFSYPHGAFTNETVEIVRRSGFRSALMAWGGTVRRGDDIMTIHRKELKEA